MDEDSTQAGRASPSGLLSLSHRSTTKAFFSIKQLDLGVYLSLDS